MKNIKKDKSMILDSYHLNKNLCKALSSTLAYMVPMKLTKIFLRDNGLTDEGLAMMLEGLINTVDLSSLGYIKNSIGPQSLDKLDSLLNQGALKSLSKLIIRDA